MNDMKTEQYKVIDLFCGCGGLSLGFQNAGYHIASAFDWWDVALNIYQKNFNHPAVKRDLSNTDDLSDLEALHPDIIIGGPPCQDYSTAGHMDENRGRAALTISYAKIVKHIMPKYFLMENVAVIEKSKTLKVVNKIFKDAGYELTGRFLVSYDSFGTVPSESRVAGFINSP